MVDPPAGFDYVSEAKYLSKQCLDWVGLCVGKLVCTCVCAHACVQRMCVHMHVCTVVVTCTSVLCHLQQALVIVSMIFGTFINTKLIKYNIITTTSSTTPSSYL